MKDSKLNINRKPLSDEDISNAENFDEVLKKYNELSGSSSSGGNGGGFFKSPWFWGLGGGVALLALALLLTLNEGDGEVDQNQTLLSERGLIAPPLEGLDIPLDTYLVQTNAGDTIHHNGSQIIIPANAFTNQQGDLVDGEVELKYREFHSLSDIFLSGIPMQYDSANYTYSFESAGMFEMKAYKDGEELKTNPESLIEVNLNSRNGGDYFNKYYLNEETGVWDYLGKDNALKTGSDIDTMSSEQIANELAEVEQRLKNAASKKPQRPTKRNEDLFSIKIEVDSEQFPELDAFGDVLFQVVDGDENFANKYAGVEWDDVKLSKEDGLYNLTFYKDMEPHVFLATPVMDDVTYATASADFDAKFQDYEENYLVQAKEDSLRYVELWQRANFISDSTGNINYRNSAEFQAQLASGRITGSITRSFKVRNFGTYNSDYPQAMPQGRMLAISNFLNKENKTDTLKFRSLHIADHETNVLISLGYNYANAFAYNPAHKTTFFIVTEDNKLGVYYPEDFEKLTETEDVDLELTVMKAPDSPNQAAAVLKL